jgi:hypothetical protein
MFAMWRLSLTRVKMVERLIGMQDRNWLAVKAPRI